MPTSFMGAQNTAKTAHVCYDSILDLPMQSVTLTKVHFHGTISTVGGEMAFEL